MAAHDADLHSFLENASDIWKEQFAEAIARPIPTKELSTRFELLQPSVQAHCVSSFRLRHPLKSTVPQGWGVAFRLRVLAPGAPHQSGIVLNLYDILQITSGFLAVGAFVPQIIKTIKTKSVGDISAPMFMMNVSAAILAEFYAYNLWREQQEPAFLITNTMVLLGAGTLLFLLLRYGKRDRQKEHGMDARSEHSTAN